MDKEVNIIDYGVVKEKPSALLDVPERLIHCDLIQAEKALDVIRSNPDYLNADFSIVPYTPFLFKIVFPEILSVGYYYEDKFFVTNRRHIWRIEKEIKIPISDCSWEPYFGAQYKTKTFESVDKAKEFLDNEIERVLKEKEFMSLKPVKYERKEK